MMVDAEGRIVLVNREVERLFGYSREELLGRPVEMLVPERLRGPHASFRAGYMGGPKVRAMGAGRDLFGLRKNGTEVPVEIGLTPVATEEGIFVLSSVVDITARHRAEKERAELEDQLRQAQKLEAIGRLAGGVAHDFNNILGAIMGFVELAQGDPDEASRKADLVEIMLAARRGKDLVESILRFSRRQNVTRLPMDLGHTIQSTSRLLQTTVPSSVRMSFRLNARPSLVMADATSVQQVLVNLASNAADAMPEGGALEIALENFYARDHFVRAHPGLHEGPYVMLLISDTGVGMDEATAARAFEPFFTTKARNKGTGLGLSIVHGIMRDHGGTVWMESARDRGTTVKCLFPAIEGAEATTPETNPEMPHGHGENLLLVEDQTPLALIGQRRLESIGYRTVVFTDPLEARAAFAANPEDFDMMITDFSMPGMNGLLLATEMTRLRPRFPVLLITGYMDSFTPEDIAQAGICTIAKKPLTHLELAQAVQKTLALAAKAKPPAQATPGTERPSARH